VQRDTARAGKSLRRRLAPEGSIAEAGPRHAAASSVYVRRRKELCDKADAVRQLRRRRCLSRIFYDMLSMQRAALLFQLRRKFFGLRRWQARALATRKLREKRSRGRQVIQDDESCSEDPILDEDDWEQWMGFQVYAKMQRFAVNSRLGVIAGSRAGLSSWSSKYYRRRLLVKCLEAWRTLGIAQKCHRKARSFARKQQTTLALNRWLDMLKLEDDPREKASAARRSSVAENAKSRHLQTWMDRWEERQSRDAAASAFHSPSTLRETEEEDPRIAAERSVFEPICSRDRRRSPTQSPKTRPYTPEGESTNRYEAEQDDVRQRGHEALRALRMLNRNREEAPMVEATGMSTGANSYLLGSERDVESAPVGSRLHAAMESGRTPASAESALLLRSRGSSNGRRRQSLPASQHFGKTASAHGASAGIDSDSACGPTVLVAEEQSSLVTRKMLELEDRMLVSEGSTTSLKREDARALEPVAEMSMTMTAPTTRTATTTSATTTTATTTTPTATSSAGFLDLAKDWTPDWRWAVLTLRRCFRTWKHHSSQQVRAFEQKSRRCVEKRAWATWRTVFASRPSPCCGKAGTEVPPTAQETTLDDTAEDSEADLALSECWSKARSLKRCLRKWGRLAGSRTELRARAAAAQVLFGRRLCFRILQAWRSYAQMVRRTRSTQNLQLQAMQMESTVVGVSLDPAARKPPLPPSDSRRRRRAQNVAAFAATEPTDEMEDDAVFLDFSGEEFGPEMVPGSGDQTLVPEAKEVLTESWDDIALDRGEMPAALCTSECMHSLTALLGLIQIRRKRVWGRAAVTARSKPCLLGCDRRLQKILWIATRSKMLRLRTLTFLEKATRTMIL